MRNETWIVRLAPLRLVVLTLLVASCMSPGESQTPRETATPSSGPRSVDIGAGARVILGGADATLSVSTANPPPSPIGWKALSPPVRLELTSGSLGQGATIEFALPEGVDPTTMGISTYDESAQEWAPVTVAFDAPRRLVTASTTHFSWWQFWTWDWAGIGASVNQRAGELVGKRAGPPTCNPSQPSPAWVSTLIGVENTDALAVRACAQSEGSVLDIQLVNNRSYGQVLNFGSSVKWSWHEPSTSLADAGFTAAMDAIVGSKGLYLPPLSRASVGVLPLAASASAEFRAGLTKASMVVDVLRVGWGALADGLGQKLGAELITSCGSRLLELQLPNSYTTLDDIRGQLLDSVDCVKAAFMKMVSRGLLDKHKVLELGATLDTLKKASAVGWILHAYDVEWKLLDVLIDTRLAAPTVPFGNGFKVVAKSEQPSQALDWLYQQRDGGYSNSGNQRTYTNSSGPHQDSTSFWVGCEDEASLTSFTVPKGARHVVGMLTLDPAITPKELVAEVTMTAGVNHVRVTLRPGVEVPLDLSVADANRLDLAVIKTAGECGFSSIGYGVAVDGHFTG